MNAAAERELLEDLDDEEVRGLPRRCLAFQTDQLDKVYQVLLQLW